MSQYFPSSVVNLQPSAPYPMQQGGVALNSAGPPPRNEQPLPTSKVDLIISCQNLMCKDVLSKSDPMVVMYVMDSRTSASADKTWLELDRTEPIKNSNDPEFAKHFAIDYRFEEQQHVKFEVYDVDSASSQLDRHDFLGEAQTTLGCIVSACSGGGKFAHKLGSSSSKDRSVNVTKGVLTVVSEEVSTSKETFTFGFRGRKLDKKDFFGLSDPFLMFYRANEAGTFSLVHKTEVIANTLNPTWKLFKLSSRVVCNGDIDRTIKVECYDWDNDGSHDLIGVFETNIRELKERGSAGKSFELVNPKKKAKKKKYVNSGFIDLVSFVSEVQPSFLDYIYSGTQIQFTVAVDFTASNGNPSQPTSLHFRNPYSPNQYVQALSEVCYVCQQYDSDRLFPSYGFGARVPPSNETMHVFPLNFQQDPHCHGVDGVLAAYHNALSYVTLYGPTNFSPVINAVAGMADHSMKSQNPAGAYFILLILTDGIISDMMQTKQAIVNASILPMSIIIVGIGPADFSAMEELDGDKKRLEYNGQYAERDIVQFVPFRDFFKPGSTAAGEQLAREVLAEIPDQIVGFMKKIGHLPIPHQ